ncbi:uncharacterized protein LOC141620906 [Silene latifolia]|uniref:uncharacterized protein LOC141620906 n=1 Tax=Silene latifolia TaxID=37657 RepID=UPI003D773A53
MVAAKAQQVLEVRLPEIQRRTITIKTLREKKVVTTLQEERHWLHVKIPEFDKKDVRFYLGCNNCGTRSDKDVDATYTCQACGREGAISSPRMNVTFEAIDATGSYAFTAFTEDAEKLLETKASALYSLPTEEKAEYLNIIETKIRHNSLYIQVGPATSLSRSRVLKWVLKQLSLD